MNARAEDDSMEDADLGCSTNVVKDVSMVCLGVHNMFMIFLVRRGFLV
jgi:hypothetical protein